jgi:ketosteroid isomerase-like protein
LRPLAALLLLVPVLAVACGGGGSASPESVVREWIDAMNAGDNERAADLYAHGAQVVQGDNVLFLQTHEDAVEFNSGLPCSGKIVEVNTDGDTATATFELGHRKARRCEMPGAKAVAAFKVLHGKIVLWHQLPSPQPPPPAAV